MTAPPIFEGVSGPFTGQGNLSVIWPADNSSLPAGRIGVLLVKSPNTPVILNPAAGFQQLRIEGIGSGQVTFVGSATPNQANPTTTFTVTIPAGVQAGDDLYQSVISRGQFNTDPVPTVVDNDGGTWTLLITSNQKKSSLYWRKATANTGGKTITVAGCINASSGILGAYRGGAAVPHTNIQMVQAIPVGTEVSDGMFPDAANSMICLTIHHTGPATGFDNPRCSNPGALTRRDQDFSTAGAGAAAMHASAAQVGGPSPTGEFSWEPSGETSESLTIVWAIRPAASGTAITGFWARPGSNPPPPQIISAGDLMVAGLLSFKRCPLTGFPFDLVTGNVHVAQALVGFPSGSSLIDNAMVIQAVAHALDAAGGQVSGWSNQAFLAGSLQERLDASSGIGAGGGFAVATAVKAARGFFGSTTAQLDDPSVQARLTLVLRPLTVSQPPPEQVAAYTFLAIQDPNDPASEMVLKVVAGSYREEPAAFQGVRRKAWAGNWVSTQRNFRRRIRLVADFYEPEMVDQFRFFVDRSLEAGVLAGPRLMYLVGDTGEDFQQTALRGQLFLQGYIEVGEMTHFDYDGFKSGWSVELRIEEG